jgi:mRNA-degrading endonuclease RelE of RelBE toxin-antitoxin system
VLSARLPGRWEPAGIYSARLGHHLRVLYEIDGAKRVVIALNVRHRSTADRRR